MFLSLFLCILLLQHFGYSYLVLLYAVSLLLFVWDFLMEKQDIMFSEEGGNICIFNRHKPSGDLRVFGTLNLFMNCYLSKLKGFPGRAQWSKASCTLKYRAGEVECGKLENLKSVELLNMV